MNTEFQPGPPDKETPLPNSLAELVFSSVDQYGDLNAPSLDAADEAFTQALRAAAEQLETKGDVMAGDSLGTYLLKNVPDLVVKRLHLGAETRGGLSRDDYWQRLQDEQEFVRSHFGDRFVPHTAFLIVKNNFGNQNPGYTDEHGNDYVMLQERAEHSPNWLLLQKPPSAELKNEIAEFIRRYEAMLQQEHKAIELDQVFVDADRNRVLIYDANHLKNLNEFMEHAQPFLRALGGDDHIATPQDVMNTLAQAIPTLSSLPQQSYGQQMRSLGDSTAEVEDWLRQRYPVETVDELKDQYSELRWGLTIFTPPGWHNPFVRKLMKTYGVTEEDLGQAH